MAPGSRVQITVWLLAAGLIPSVLPGQGVIHREVSQGWSRNPATDAGMTYCYRPHDAVAPAGLTGEDFSVSALEDRTGPNRDVGTQVFGVAQDDVAGARVQVAGSWQKLPISDNALYLDLPGVPRSDLGTVEVTLSDGSTQLHDLQTGL